MQPKNVMLLGFINKAVEYIDKTVGDEMPNDRLAGLRNIDLATIKQELSDNLDSSLGMMQSTMTSLLKAGEDAFFEFAKIENGKKPSFMEMMADEFAFDYEEKRDNKKELANLLKYYSLDILDFDDDLDDYSSLKENTEIKTELPLNTVTELENKIDELTEDPTVDDLILEELEDEKEETPASELDEESLRLMAEIEANVLKARRPSDYRDSHPAKNKAVEAKIEQIFTEIEENIPEVTEIETEEDTVEETVTPVVTETELCDKTADKECPCHMSVENVGGTKEDTAVKTDTPLKKNECPCSMSVEHVSDERPAVTENTNNGVYGNYIDELRKKMIEEERNEAETVEETDTHESVEDVKEQVETVPATETVAETDNAEETAPVTENTKEDKSYVSDLIDELRTQMVKEDEVKAKKEEENREIFAQISKMYPYLPKSFISVVYDLKDELANEYDEGAEIILLNRIRFNDVERLRQFVEITINHGYMINADEKKMIVDIFKPFVNKDGRIITNIFEVANQASLLEGEYEGYRVIVQ